MWKAACIEGGDIGEVKEEEEKEKEEKGRGLMGGIRGCG